MFRKRRDKLAPHEHENYLRYMMFVLETAVKNMKHGQEQWVWILDLAGELTWLFSHHSLVTFVTDSDVIHGDASRHICRHGIQRRARSCCFQHIMLHQYVACKPLCGAI